MKAAISSLNGIVVGVAIGIGLLLAFGAAGPARSFPRYSVDTPQGALMITDNDRNVLYLYEAATDVGQPERISHFRLHSIINLEGAGQPELRAKAEDKQ